MSEKLDGVRAYWDGTTLFSRHGKQFPLPEWFARDLPKQLALDGELWMGQGTFERLMALLNASPATVEDREWKSIKYMVFDLPKSGKPFEGRMKELSELSLPPHVNLVGREVCEGNGFLVERLETLVKHGGEGLMLNKPSSDYVAERTGCLLKVKVSRVVSKQL